MVRHDAFISYSRRDKAFAVKLEQRLEKYKAPKDLPVRQGYLDVFRDETDFTGADYLASLARHLEDSATLIVLCSPSARASEYVNDEIRRFVALKGAERLVPVLVSGIPNNEATPQREAEKAFPEALCEALPMPLAANYLNFDTAEDRVDRGAYSDAWFTVLANIYRVSRSEIEQREHKRRARFVRMAVLLTASIVALLVVALILTLLSRAEAVRQAIEARRETSTRLAVQALEKIKGTPETALGLAIEAVEIYHAHGDPPVSRALEALHRARLAFGGGRPVIPWRADQAVLIFSSDLVWAASGSESGEVRFTRSGSGAVRVLASPPLLEPGETWVEEAPALLFTGDRLVAGRKIQRAGKRSADQAVLWYWPLSKHGVTEPARHIARFDARSWTRLDPLASPGGRWLSWFGYGERDSLFLKELETDREPIVIQSDDELRAQRIFSEDEMAFLAGTDAGLVVISLETLGGTGVDADLAIEHNLETSSWKLKSSLVLAAYSPPRYLRRPDDQETGFSRVAIVYDNGDAEWWDMTEALPQRKPLGNVFSAFASEMRVWRLDPGKVRADLRFSPSGIGLLAVIEETSGEFGIVAHIDLTKQEGWQPIVVEQLKHQLFARTHRVRGDNLGARSGYRLEDQKKLGAAHANWFSDSALLTIGFDGSLEFHNLENDRSQFLSAQIAAVAPWDNIKRLGIISAGTDEGELKLFGEEGSEPLFVLAGHDAPVAQVIHDLSGRRIVTVDRKGSARVWELSNPVLRPDLFRRVEDDWRLFYQGEREVRAWDPGAPDPFLKAVGVMPDKPSLPHSESPDRTWAAILEVSEDDPAAVSVALYRRGDEGFADTPGILHKLTLPADIELGKHWRWERRGRLMVDADRMLFLLLGRAIKGSGAFLVDLNDPATGFVTVLHPREGFKVEKVTDDLGRMLITRGELRSKAEERALEVRGVAVRSGEQIVRIAGEMYGDLSSDGRWLVTNDAIIDLGGATAIQRTLREPPHKWRYRVEFKGGRPPLWLDEEGNLWGLDHAPGAKSPARQLLSGLDLTEISWAPSGEWLGLGTGKGRVRVVALAADARFVDLSEALASTERASALPASWDEHARVKIEAIDLLPDLGWVSARTSSDMFLLWRGGPGGAWAEPLTLHESDGLYGDRDFTCRPKGDLCLLYGQLLSFDEPQLITMSKALLTGSSRRF